MSSKFDAMVTVLMAYEEGDYSNPIFWRSAENVADELNVSIKEYDLWINTLADKSDYTYKLDGETATGADDIWIHQSSMSQLIEDFWFRDVNWDYIG